MLAVQGRNQVVPLLKMCLFGKSAHRRERDIKVLPRFDLGVHAFRQQFVEVLLQLYVRVSFAVYRRGHTSVSGPEVIGTKDILDMESNIEIPWNDSVEFSVLGTCNIERVPFAILE